MEEPSSSICITKVNQGGIQSNSTYECHGCKNAFNSSKVIQCINDNCKCVYCFKCIAEKYYSFTNRRFQKLKRGNRWICYKCKLVCNCETCLQDILKKNPNKTSQSNQWFLQKKRSRIVRKITKTHIKLISGENKSQYRLDSSSIKVPMDNSNITLKSNEKISSSKDNSESIKKDFPNYSNNILLNKFISQAANSCLSSGNKIPKKKSNKPCILCAKFKCPLGIEIIKFKTYEDYVTFLTTLFKDVDNELNKPLSKNVEDRSVTPLNFSNELTIIANHKKNLSKIQENQKMVADNKLKGPKRFCSNCIANRFREQNGLFSIYDNLNDEDEQASLEPKKKLEIMNGIHQLIKKEGKSLKKDGKECGSNAYNYLADTIGENKEIKDNNIFDEIFSGTKVKKDQKQINEIIPNTQLNLNDNSTMIEILNDPKKIQQSSISNKELTSNFLYKDLTQLNDINYSIQQNNPNFHNTIGSNNDGTLMSHHLSPYKNVVNNDETNKYLYIRNLGYPHNNTNMNYNLTMNNCQENRAGLINLSGSNPGLINNNVMFDNIYNPYMINPINQYPNLRSPNIGPLSNANMMFPFNQTRPDNYNQNLTNDSNPEIPNAKKYFSALENLSNLITQLEFTLKLTINARNESEFFLSNYIESRNPEEKSYYKSRLDEASNMLLQQVLICNTLMMNYQNELSLNLNQGNH